MSTIAIPATTSERIGWPALPLVVCYLLVPVPMILTQIVGLPPVRVAFDVALAGIAGIALLAILASGRLRLFESADLAVVLGGLAIVAFAARVVAAYAIGDVSLGFAAMEIKPLFYVVIALLCLLAFGPPTPEAFIRCGSWLGVLLTAECIVRSAIEGVLTRAVGAAEVNYDAALLVLSLCFALAQPWRWRWYILAIFLGLLATMSRTALASALLIIVLTSRLSLSVKFLMVVFGLASTTFSFAYRGQSLGDLSTLDRLWMWIVGLDLLAKHPFEMLFGFPTGQPLPVRQIPEAIRWIWVGQQGASEGGVFPFHFHAFWLRSTVTWGLLATIAAMTALLLPVYRRDRTLAIRLTLFLLIEGMTMGLFYLSNVAVPLLLSFSAVAVPVLRHSRAPAPEPAAHGQTQAQ